MKKMIVVIFSIYLLLPIFVYELKSVSKVHVMKFTGSFSVIYEDSQRFSKDLTLSQAFIIPTNNKFQYIFDSFQKINSFQELYLSNISFLISLSRAPPIFSV